MDGANCYIHLYKIVSNLVLNSTIMYGNDNYACSKFNLKKLHVEELISCGREYQKEIVLFMSVHRKQFVVHDYDQEPIAFNSELCCDNF